MRSLGISADIQAELVARIFPAVIYMTVMWERVLLDGGFD